MKILVLGGNGMLGHQLVRRLGQSSDVYTTVRGDGEQLVKAGIAPPGKVLGGIDVLNYAAVEKVIDDIRPDAVLNAIGVIKRRKEDEDACLSIEINSLLPHRLARSAASIGARFITFSTDCVFFGDKGSYSEDHPTDARDLYGRTKALGEVTADHCVTIRTSIIGRELSRGHSLVEWVISQRGKTIKGFARAMYSGFTTLEMARIVEMILKKHTDLCGIYHVSSDPINKYALLKLINKHFDLGIRIERDEDFVIDRTLRSDRFRAETGFVPKSWDEMIMEMAPDASDYEKWRKLRF